MTEHVTSFQRVGGTDAQGFREEAKKLFTRSYAEAFAESDSVFRSAAAFMQRFDAYSSNPRLDLVIARREGEIVGQSWGWPDDTRWQAELDQPLSPSAAEKMGGPSFALSEIMVDKKFWGIGLARALHDELLRGRSERIATLFVDPVNERAYTRYLRWGWVKVGTSRPGWEGAPTFDVLMAEIPALVTD